MAKQNVDFLAWNRGIVSPLALARTDVERTRLSAEEMTNWLPKTQGAMRIRPGTKYLGSSLADAKAQWLEFVASTTDVALVELTDGKMRVWLADTGGDEVPISRPPVDTVLTLTDTGWSNTSTGGSAASGTTSDRLPTMTANTVGNVTVTASSQNVTVAGGLGVTNRARNAANDDNGFSNGVWGDTGQGNTTLPSWWNADFGADTGEWPAIRTYSLKAGFDTYRPARMAQAWRLISSNYDTGTYASDTGKWVLHDEQTAQTGWGTSEKRTYTTFDGDTGSVPVKRHWRFYITASNLAGNELQVDEFELFSSSTIGQVSVSGGRRYFNATSIGAIARAEKRVIVSDTGTEHALAIYVERGPVTLRVGATQRADDYIEETALGTGYHNLAFTPTGDFWVTLQSDAIVDRIVGSLTMSDTGTMELTAPYTDTGMLDAIRYDQSADVLYLDAIGVAPRKIERRGTGRSWSIVNYAPDNGPFLTTRSSGAKLKVAQTYGNTTLTSDIPFFKAEHVGALFRAFHDGQSGTWILGAEGAATDPIEVTGIGDTGTASANNERRVAISVTGTWAGTITVQRSFDGPDIGFHDTDLSDTGTYTRNIDDRDDNVVAWYRFIIKPGDYTSGAAVAEVTYKSGGKTGICRVTGYQTNQVVDVEVLARFSSTEYSDNWQEGYWSAARSYPSAVALHEGRLFHAGGANVFGSVSDDYENFDDETEGDAAPIIRTLGRGPVDVATFLLPLLRLIVGTAGSEIALRASSTDEVLTPTNCSAKPVSTQGSTNLRGLVVDSRGIFVQRSGQRVFAISFGESVASVGDYESRELTLLVPDLLEAGVVSVGLQRQPDTRLHFVLADGRVAILTFEPNEEVLCWSIFETDGVVERAAVLPGENEDRVFYHVNRTINGATKRYLERWAMESEAAGGQLNWIMDAAVKYEGVAATSIPVNHLVGEAVVAWGNDTGQTAYGMDLSPDDTGGTQTTYTVAGGGSITLTTAKTKVVAGLPFTARYKTTKLAYGAQFGTALTQHKRVNQIGLILAEVHNNGLFLGSDTGTLYPLPRLFDRGAQVDADKVFPAIDNVAIPFDGEWESDPRIVLRAKAPRPVTVMAAVPTVTTNERV